MSSKFHLRPPADAVLFPEVQIDPKYDTVPLLVADIDALRSDRQEEVSQVRSVPLGESDQTSARSSGHVTALGWAYRLRPESEAPTPAPERRRSNRALLRGSLEPDPRTSRPAGERHEARARTGLPADVRQHDIFGGSWADPTP
jgi:hypothetical protein